MTTFDTKTKSRDDSAPVNLFTFSGNEDTETQVENLLHSVCLIPGTTEFGYGTTVVRKEDGGFENAIQGGSISDYSFAMDQLIERAPNLKHVSLVVAWHGSDLRIGECEVKPKVDPTINGNPVKVTTPYAWQVGPLVRGAAEEVTILYDSGKEIAAAGGAPSDRSVWECITDLKARGLKVTVYPFILMDIPPDNALPNPYGGAAQPAFPWRGRVTCYPAAGQSGTVDQTAAAATQVANFFGTTTPSDFDWDDTNKIVTYSGPANEWSFRRHILHISTIADAAGADDILIGTEMVGMTSIRSDSTTYPAVDQLISLAADVRAIVGDNVNISYAADWSEYHSHRPNDGSDDVIYNLDPLWADANIDYIGVDNYLPLSDWREGEDHLDIQIGWASLYDRNYMRSNVEGGEYYEWFYASQEDRDNQIRTPISGTGPQLESLPLLETKPSGQEEDLADDYTLETRTFQARVTLPSTAQDAALYTHGGRGYRAWLGVTADGSLMRLRAGSGLGALSDSNTDTVVLNVPTTYLPFDGEFHVLTWEIAPAQGTVRLWVDGFLVGESRTQFGGPIQTESFVGWGNSTWLTSASGDGDPANDYARAPFVPAESQVDWPVFSTQGLLEIFNGEALFTENNTKFVYQQKNFRSWWGQKHYNRVGGSFEATPTLWSPESKPIVFTEIGCPAINRGSNQPNVFVDAKSSESDLPHYSLGLRDDLVQRIFLEASLSYWADNNKISSVYGGNMVNMERASVWAWDSRPSPDFPNREDVWGDSTNWDTGHWISGRLERPIETFGVSSVHRYTDSTREIEFGGNVYTPLPVNGGSNRLEGNLPNTQFEVKVPKNSELASLFHGFRPAHPVSLTVHQGHMTDGEKMFTPRWSGKILSTKRSGPNLVLSGAPYSAAVNRTGLRRNYQIGCPHVLYGEKCRANKDVVTDTAVAMSVTGSQVTLPLGWSSRDMDKFVGGIAEWSTAEGTIERRRVLKVTDGTTLVLSGAARGMEVGSFIKVSLGCNHTVSDCAELHSNMANYGGCPTIPTKNPLDSSSNNFY